MQYIKQQQVIAAFLDKKIDTANMGPAQLEEALMAVKEEAAAAAAAAKQKVAGFFRKIRADLTTPDAKPSPLPSPEREANFRRRWALAGEMLIEKNDQIERAIATGDRALLSPEEEEKACAVAAKAQEGIVLASWLVEMQTERRSRSMGHEEIADAIMMVREAAAEEAKAGSQMMAATFEAARAKLPEPEPVVATAEPEPEPAVELELDTSVAEGSVAEAATAVAEEQPEPEPAVVAAAPTPMPAPAHGGARFYNNKKKGKGKGKGKGKEKGKPRPGDEPGNQPGRGNKDDI